MHIFERKISKIFRVVVALGFRPHFFNCPPDATGCSSSRWTLGVFFDRTFSVVHTFTSCLYTTNYDMIRHDTVTWYSHVLFPPDLPYRRRPHMWHLISLAWSKSVDVSYRALRSCRRLSEQPKTSAEYCESTLLSLCSGWVNLDYFCCNKHIWWPHFCDVLPSSVTYVVKITPVGILGSKLQRYA